MSTKWTGSQSETGILRKSEFKEKKEELFVFGYSCKLFRDDDRAQQIDQGKHLIPWMGDETLKIDRYDARGALHDLSIHEAPRGGYDGRVELTKTEYEVEQLCDEERYRALHTDEDEELMYKEEELKRLHAAGYGQVGFNYDTPAEPSPTSQPAEVDEPFIPAAHFKALFQHDVVFPASQKQNAIIEKTAKFIATQGAQMEILIKAKQRDNPQFKFLEKDNVLHSYYTAFIILVKTEKWPEKKVEVIEEKPHEHEEYLHPSLASTIIESAPSIPSIHYKPSADCDYTMLISKMRGAPDDTYTGELAPGELPPPGTEPPVMYSRQPVMYNLQAPPPTPVQQTQAMYQQYAAYYQQYMASQAAAAPAPVQQAPPVKPVGPAAPVQSTGLSLMKNYDSGSESDMSDSEDSSSNDSKSQPVIVAPPDDVKVVIEKMATYVARNGDEFAEIVRAKNDPRFTFLDPTNEYHPYYKKLMNEKRGIDANGTSERDKKGKPVVSFSIKKLKEPDPILPKPALPYESSSDEESEKQDGQTDKQADKPEEMKPVQNLVPQIYSVNNMPPVVVYKMEGQLTHNLPTVKTIEPVKQYVKPVPELGPKEEQLSIEQVVQDDNKSITETSVLITRKESPLTVKEKESTPVKEDTSSRRNSVESKENDRARVIDTENEKVRQKESSPNHKREKKRLRERREHIRERRSKSREREKRKEKDRDREKKRRKVDKDDLESEIISLEDNSDDMIDLTGDQSDSKVEGDTEAEKAKQMERRRRAAEFLKKVGVDPGAAALPTNSLASAMVDTLETLRKKKAAEEEKQRRKEKRRRREKRDYDESEKSHRKSKRRKYKSSDDDDNTDHESNKKKKRKKDKKPKSKKKKRQPATEEEEQDHPLAANIDLTSTLKELRTNSPTKNLLIPDVEENIAEETSTEEEEEVKEKKKNREYSEGEWSSDSEADSASSFSKFEE